MSSGAELRCERCGRLAFTGWFALDGTWTISPTCRCDVWMTDEELEELERMEEQGKASKPVRVSGRHTEIRLGW